MGCDFYINKVLNIECKDGSCESEIIDQTQYYKDDWEERSMYNQYKSYELTDDDVYDSDGWDISDDETIKEYKKIVKQKGISMENVKKIYISQDYVKNW